MIFGSSFLIHSFIDPHRFVVKTQSSAAPYNVDFDNGDSMDIYEDMLWSIGFSELKESAGISKSVFRNHKFFAIFGKHFRLLIIIFGIRKNVASIGASYRYIIGIVFIFCILSTLDLTPNCDNTRYPHPSFRGNDNLEVTCNEATQTTITVLMYTVSSGEISAGKDFDVQMLSTDY